MKHCIVGIFLMSLGLGTITAQKKMEKSMQIDIDIPFQKFTLDNGLTVVIHEDHKAPIVAVNVWYHVGSKNERPGKSGFAHLFEHLMFNGSENYDKDYFQVMEGIGATDLNGTTNEDRTNYFQNVPVSAFDLTLWMESDRMGHLLGAVTQAKLDEQRGVVQNEKRQGENQPYAISEELTTKSTWPAGHPYSWTVIGSMEDLNAASLEDVKEWFRGYYGAANATVVIAGDVETKAALEKVRQYFGDIPPGPPVARHEAWVAKRTGHQRQVAQDRVPQARLYKVWNVPQWGTQEGDYLDLISDVLGSGKNSRLYKRLVYDDQVATSARAYVDLREIGGLFTIDVTAKPGEDLAKIEKAVQEELEKFLAEGPTDKEMERIITQYQANFIRGTERIGGFGGKSDILARYQVYMGDPAGYKKTLEHVRSATAKKLQQTAQAWLSDGDYALEIHPFPDFKTIETKVDRKSLPVMGVTPDVKFPDLQRATLSNGMKVILAERKTVPVVNFNLLFDAGYASDQFASPGTATLAMNMLDEGTKERSSLEINEQLSLLGATLNSGSDLDVSSVFMSALKANLDASLDIYADVILHPAFPEADFARLQKQVLVGIQQEKANPIQMALRVYPRYLYGKEHAYGLPLTGSGYETTVSKLTRDDLVKFHQTWFKPNNATLIVVGDISLKDVTAKFEKLFKDWKRGETPKKNISTVNLPAKPVVYLMDKPGAQQSIIFAGHVTLPYANPDETAVETMNNILGGDFVSRINMNLREDKHWAYGAFSFMIGARGQRPFIGYAPVQSDKTKESMVELSKELNEYIGTRPASEEEFDRTQRNQILGLPGSWETMNAVGRSVYNIVRYGLSDDYYATYAQRVKALKLADIRSAAKKVIKPANLTWLVVGDRAKIEAGIRELGYGEIRIIDTDGNLVQ